MQEPHAHSEGGPEGADPVVLQRFLQRGPRSRTRAWIRFGVLSLLGGALVFALHGAAFHLTPWSQAIVNGIAKHWYPHFGQDDTTVVLFREENLEKLHETYPISYQVHADVLDAIKKYEPRAVFVDFVFLDKPRPGMVEKGKRLGDSKRLRETICGLNRVGTVFLAVDPEGQTGIAQELVDERGPCVVKVTPEMEDISGVSGVLTYGNGVKLTNSFLPTPAFALAIGNDKIPGLCGNTHGFGLCAEHLEPMEVLWGNRVPKLNARWMESCEPAPWRSQLWSSLHHYPLQVKQACPYTQTISVWKDSRALGKAAGEAAVAIAGGADPASLQGVSKFNSGKKGVEVNAILLTPNAITKDTLNEVIDAGWITKAEACAGVKAGTVKACD